MTRTGPPQKTAPKFEKAPGSAPGPTRPGPPEMKTGHTPPGPGKPAVVSGLEACPNDAIRVTYLDGVVNSAGAGLEVEIVKVSPLPADLSSGFYVRSRFRLTVRGTWADVSKYAALLQKAEEFRFVRRVAMVSQAAAGVATENAVTAQVELEKWWAQPEEAESGKAAGDSLTKSQQEFLQRAGSTARLPLELLRLAITPVFTADSQVRVNSFEAEREFDSTLEKAQLVIKGETPASNAQPALQYMTAVKGTAGLKGFHWEAAPLAASGDTGSSFTLSGTLLVDGNGPGK